MMTNNKKKNLDSCITTYFYNTIIMQVKGGGVSKQEKLECFANTLVSLVETIIELLNLICPHQTGVDCQ